MAGSAAGGDDDVFGLYSLVAVFGFDGECVGVFQFCGRPR